MNFHCLLIAVAFLIASISGFDSILLQRHIIKTDPHPFLSILYPIISIMDSPCVALGMHSNHLYSP